MKHYGKCLLLAGVFTLAACQSGAKPAAQANNSAAENDECGASQYQNYVGKPLTALEGTRFPTQVRAIPWNSAVTMDFNLRRLNFLADKDGKIERVYCG